MDQDRFDRIAKSLAAPGSRRRALRGLLGAAIGGAGLLGGERVAADHGCRHDGKGCDRAGQCCSGRCAANNTCQPCTRAGQCPGPANPCERAVCTAKGRCEVRNKPAGAACPDDGDLCTAGGQCDGSGACTHPALREGTACSDGKVCCGGACTSLGTDADCAGCGDACTAPETCGGGGTAGRCGCTPDCAGKACGASDGCTGTCQAGSCPDGQFCQGGQCGACASGVVCSGTCCVDTGDGFMLCSGGAEGEGRCTCYRGGTSYFCD